jgi:hypothetical protein
MKKIAFTIVLNGIPFIKKQSEILPLVFDEWHIIEGATLPLADTAWCKNINNEFYTEKKLSTDGTTEFIDSIVDNKKIFVHRKNNFWNGKIEMCNQIEHLMENCILMQFDVDEIWNKETLIDILNYAQSNDYFDGMLFKCNYYVGPNLIITNENCYGNYSNEWCRLWKIKEKTKWVSHEPPRIKGLKTFLTKDYTKNKNWIFDHYAYVIEEQLKFKENFYGYKNALNLWKNLQQNEKFPCFLRDYLSWVHDDSVVNIKNEN